jgi:hypothetical protein
MRVIVRVELALARTNLEAAHFHYDSKDIEHRKVKLLVYKTISNKNFQKN